MYGLIVVLLSIVSLSLGQTCVYTAPDGTFYNLTSARNPTADYTFNDAAAQATYFINFCGETIVPCNASGACMEPFFSLDNYFSLGLYSTQAFLDVPDDGWAGLTLQFSEGSDCPESPGSQRNITVNVKCAYGQPTTFISGNQDMDCSFTAYFTSAAACPARCPEGKRGGTCATCLEGYYGPNCLPCQCQFGACNANTGACACQPGWTGATCATCAPSRCAFNESNAFLYNITTLAAQEVDYTFVNGGFEYYINLLANTNNACGGLNTPVCQKAADGTFMSLGSLQTETIQTLEGTGLAIAYQNGSFCTAANVTSSVSISISCVPGAETEVTWVQMTTPCAYSIEINSGAVCPACAPGYFGEDCSSCQCSNSLGCNDGISGNGTCNCKPGYTGESCEACASGHYGSSCTACSCDLGNSICMDGMKGTGHCICYSGYEGDNCDKKSGPINQWAYAGVGLAIGLVVGVAVAVGICMFMNSRKRQYDSLEK